MGQKVKRNEFPQALLDAVEAMGMDIVLVNDWPSEYWIGWRESRGAGQTPRIPDRKRP